MLDRLNQNETDRRIDEGNKDYFPGPLKPELTPEALKKLLNRQRGQSNWG